MLWCRQVRTVLQKVDAIGVAIEFVVGLSGRSPSGVERGLMPMSAEC
jgi:hypothetical protein